MLFARRLGVVLTSIGLLTTAACGGVPADSSEGSDELPGGGDGESGKADNAEGFNDLNLAAGSQVLYEVQVRAANACRTDTGSAAQKSACAGKIAPKISYHAEGMSCGMIDDLERIKLGTLDDMLENTADYRAGITLRYIKERVGATTVWLMPLFPNNDIWSIPDACDNLGSPYSVRDYMHAAGTLSRACIEQGRDEYSSEPCWANGELDEVIEQAHSRGLKVMLDVALNHFGHNYLMYDVGDFIPLRDRIAGGENLERLWDFAATYEDGLLRPEVVDTQQKLEQLAKQKPAQGKLLAQLRQKCPELEGDALVRSFHMYRNALDHERATMSCEGRALEFEVPGFYLGANSFDPSSKLGDNFTNNWRDVKFLFHHEENQAHKWEFYRDREYLFRVLNYWVSRGIDGFRFDHTTDPNGGMGSKEWDYLVSKLDYYAYRRGQERPIYLAEEFHEQMEMNKVMDILTEGYVGDMTGRSGITKDAAHVEKVIENGNRFGEHVFVMSALETHDEHRLTDGTGFNLWTGAGFWGIGATTRSTPMLLMGQEFGEPWGLGFRRSDLLRGRFEGTANYNAQGAALVDFYGKMAGERLKHENRALRANNHWYLRPRDNPDRPDPRIFAMAKWYDGNVVFVFHNLWEQNVAQSYYLPSELKAKASIRNEASYKLVDLISGRQQGGCRSGSDLGWDFPVLLDAGTRAQWLRLELCQ